MGCEALSKNKLCFIHVSILFVLIETHEMGQNAFSLKIDCKCYIVDGNSLTAISSISAVHFFCRLLVHIIAKFIILKANVYTQAFLFCFLIYIQDVMQSI